jgi:hypothetical protein
LAFRRKNSASQADQAAAAHKVQMEQQKAQNDAIHQQVKTQAEIQLAKIKAELDAKIALLDAHLKAATEQQKMRPSPVPGSRKARDGHHYVPDPKRPRQIPDGGSSWLIFLWCLWTINRISEMSHLFLLTTIRSAPTA